MKFSISLTIALFAVVVAISTLATVASLTARQNHVVSAAR